MGMAENRNKNPDFDVILIGSEALVNFCSFSRKPVEFRANAVKRSPMRRATVSDDIWPANLICKS
jgi:hypothetical protein